MYHYRKNAAVILINQKNQILMVQTINAPGKWKFVQGGVKKGEELVDAAKREVREEVGLTNIKILAQSKHIHKYDWPKNTQKEKKKRGQKQSFFIAIMDKESKIKLDLNELTKYSFFEKNEIYKKAGYKNLKESIEIIQKEFPELLTYTRFNTISNSKLFRSAVSNTN
ncbi:MAG: NUDIX domain-containing protein [archaeon]